MIKLMPLLESRYDYGCVMARIDEEAARLLLDFNYKTISEDLIYKEGKDFGREQHPHCTIKYGLVQPYTEEQMKQLLRNVIPFDVQVKGISVFENDNRYDVVKFDVDGPELYRIREIFDRLPNHDEYGSEYHPHLTLAYVKKGLGKKFIRNPNKFARVPVKTIDYSDRGNHMYFNLQESYRRFPAVRTKDGKIYIGRIHADAVAKTGDAELESTGWWSNGTYYPEDTARKVWGAASTDVLEPDLHRAWRLHKQVPEIGDEPVNL